jgi:hypothetical protein
LLSLSLSLPSCLLFQLLKNSIVTPVRFGENATVRHVPQCPQGAPIIDSINSTGGQHAPKPHLCRAAPPTRNVGGLSRSRAVHGLSFLMPGLDVRNERRPPSAPFHGAATATGPTRDATHRSPHLALGQSRVEPMASHCTDPRIPSEEAVQSSVHCYGADARSAWTRGQAPIRNILRRLRRS